MESNYNVETQMRSKPALHMFHVQLPTDFTDSINKYIDDTLIPLDDNYGKVKGNAELQHSYSKGLVGQIRQDKRSAQLDFDIFNTSAILIVGYRGKENIPFAIFSVIGKCGDFFEILFLYPFIL